MPKSSNSGLQGNDRLLQAKARHEHMQRTFKCFRDLSQDCLLKGINRWLAEKGILPIDSVLLRNGDFTATRSHALIAYGNDALGILEAVRDDGTIVSYEMGEDTWPLQRPRFTRDTILEIASRIEALADLLAMKSTCREWNKALKDEQLWKPFFERFTSIAPTIQRNIKLPLWTQLASLLFIQFTGPVKIRGSFPFSKLWCDEPDLIAFYCGILEQKLESTEGAYMTSYRDNSAPTMTLYFGRFYPRIDIGRRIRVAKELLYVEGGSQRTLPVSRWIEFIREYFQDRGLCIGGPELEYC